MYNIKVKKIKENAKIPTRGSAAAAGYDLYSANEKPIIIKPGETAKIGIGLQIELPDNTFGAIYPRSGLAIKQGLRLSNCTAVIDSDYRGEYIVALYNDSNEERTIEPNERIAQLVLQRYEEMTFEEVDEVSETERGSGGFGSTGLK